METLDILKNLSSLCGISGAEQTKNEYLHKILKEYTPDSYSDALGNCIAKIKGNGKKQIMLEAHLDTVGLIVTGIDEKSGFLRVDKCGGADERIMSAQRVKVFGKRVLDGVIPSTPPHLGGESNKKTGKISVDCGLPYEEIREIVSYGDRIEITNDFFTLKNGTVSGTFLDNNAGIAAIIKALDLLKDKELPCDLSVVFATREETGKQGAQAACFSLQPDEAIALDVTFSAAPGVVTDICTGKGIAIGASPILQKEMTSALCTLAEKIGVPYCVEVMGRGTHTDADVITVSGKGVKTGLISIPLKNMHTPVEIAAISDIELTAKMLEAFVLQGGIINA
ncbi:MAG: M20/M25/M40 family metallo-hydrolase [Clostridia bacterium]|nr:M20/M25/M40 family metallo-hydrolase [Clostridia bacterium]